MAEPAACRISLFESDSMLNNPSRKSGNQSSMLISGTESSTVIQPMLHQSVDFSFCSRDAPTSSCLMYGLERRMYFCRSGINRSTSKESDSVTTSLTSLSNKFAPFFTSISTSANSLHNPSNIWLKYLRMCPLATLAIL